MCCVQLNETGGGSRWVSCGTTPKQTMVSAAGAVRALDPSGVPCRLRLAFQSQHAELSPGFGLQAAGIVLDEGPGCGYVFAPNAKVTASLAFVCDQTAVGRPPALFV